MDTMHIRTAMTDFGWPLFHSQAKPQKKDAAYRMRCLFFFIGRHCLPETKALFRFNGKAVWTKSYTIETPIVKKDPDIISMGDMVAWDESNVPAALRQELGEGLLQVRKISILDDTVIATFATGKDNTTLIPTKGKYNSDKERTELVVQNMQNGKCFITPKHLIKKV